MPRDPRRVRRLLPAPARTVRGQARLPLGELRADPGHAARGRRPGRRRRRRARKRPGPPTSAPASRSSPSWSSACATPTRALAGDAPDRAPIAALVELARTTAAAIDAIDLQLATLDEGALVRALARSEARREAPALRVDLLAGLDTLRQLEDQRAVLFGRLLEITSLARTAIELHLAHAAAAQTDDIEVARAFEALRLT